MNIFPKIGETDFNNLSNLESYLTKTEGVEIQLMGDDLQKGFERSCVILEHFDNINYVIFHMPFSMINLPYICSNRFVSEKFIDFVICCIKYNLMTGKVIDILIHSGLNLKEFIGSNGIDFLSRLVNSVKNTNVGFLIENSIISLNLNDNEEDCLSGIFRNFEHNKIKFCFDLCHWQSSEFALGRELIISDILLKNLKNVHFSMTRNNEGYKNKKATHGRVHLDINTCQNDLKYLEEKGVDLSNVNLVTEISEEDYVLRPEMKQELALLEDIVKQ